MSKQQNFYYQQTLTNNQLPLNITQQTHLKPRKYNNAINKFTARELKHNIPPYSIFYHT